MGPVTAGAFPLSGGDKTGAIYRKAEEVKDPGEPNTSVSSPLSMMLVLGCMEGRAARAQGPCGGGEQRGELREEEVEVRCQVMDGLQPLHLLLDTASPPPLA